MFFYLCVPVGKIVRISEETLPDMSGVYLPVTNIMVVIFKETPEGMRLSVAHSDFTFSLNDLIEEAKWVGKNCRYLIIKSYAEQQFTERRVTQAMSDAPHVIIDKKEIFLEGSLLKNFSAETIAAILTANNPSPEERRIIRHPKEFQFNITYPIKLFLKQDSKFTRVIFDGQHWVDIPKEEYRLNKPLSHYPIQENRKFDVLLYQTIFALMIKNKISTLLPCHYELKLSELLLLAHNNLPKTFDFVTCVRQTVHGLRSLTRDITEKGYLLLIEKLLESAEPFTDISVLIGNPFFNQGNLSIFKSCVILSLYYSRYQKLPAKKELIQRAETFHSRADIFLNEETFDEDCTNLKSIHTTFIKHLQKSACDQHLLPFFRIMQNFSALGSDAFKNKNFATSVKHFDKALTMAKILYSKNDSELGSAYHNCGAANHESWLASGKLSELVISYDLLCRAKKIRMLHNDQTLASTVRRIVEIRTGFLDQMLPCVKELYTKNCVQQGQELMAVCYLTAEAIYENPPQFQYTLCMSVAEHCYSLWKNTNQENYKKPIQDYFKSALEMAEKLQENILIEKTQSALLLFYDTLFVREMIHSRLREKWLFSSFYHTQDQSFSFSFS